MNNFRLLKSNLDTFKKMADFEFTVGEDLCKVDCHHYNDCQNYVGTPGCIHGYSNKSPYVMIYCNLSNTAFHDFVKSLKN